jgi:thiamine-phosphate pyrophosphorylase
VQLREKDAPLARMLADAGALAQLSRAYGAAFLVNDRIDVALAADADGVHLGPDDMPVGVARRITPARMLVGFSAGTPGEARDAEKSGASYLGVGAVRRTSTKTDAGDPIGPCGVAEVRAVTRLPIVAIGGVRVQDVDELIAAGADGVAVASAILESSDPEAAAASFVRAVGTARTRYARAR